MFSPLAIFCALQIYFLVFFVGNESFVSENCQNSGNPNDVRGNDKVFNSTADHEDVTGSGCIITRILKVTVRNECSVSRPSHFNPEEVPYTSWIGNFLKNRVGLEALEKKEYVFSLLQIKPRLLCCSGHKKVIYQLSSNTYFPL